jgi:hypothetical protein
MNAEPAGAHAGLSVRSRIVLAAFVTSAVLMAAPATAQERYAVIVSGATGGTPYAEQYAGWTVALSETLVGRLGFQRERVSVLSETADPQQAATAANVRRAFAALASAVERDDLLFVMLIGHGTFDGADAKFNLVGPDLEAAEWASLFEGIRGRVVFVNGAAASFPFIERLSAPNRIVLSATGSPAERFATVFPAYFVAAFGEPAADIDKNGRVSIWEAFAWAAAGVRRYYRERGQLATERALLDDDGDGQGREAAGQGTDGALASRTYLDRPDPGAAPTDEVLVDLLLQQASLAAEVEELQVKRAFMSAGEYAREFERVMVALARVTRAIRARSGT